MKLENEFFYQHLEQIYARLLGMAKIEPGWTALSLISHFPASGPREMGTFIIWKKMFLQNFFRNN